jgi:hypothetical protein
MLLPSFFAESKPVITYVRVEHPKLDLVHVILGAFSATATLVVIALLLGIAFAVTLILRRRRERPYQPGVHLSER